MAADARSLLNLYRQLIALRRERPALHAGSYVSTYCDRECLAFERRHDETRLLVVLNFGQDARRVALPCDAPRARLLLSTSLDREAEKVERTVDLRPSEGAVLELRAD